MRRNAFKLFLICMLSVLITISCQGPEETFPDEAGLTPVEQLGKKIFFDTSLSTPPGQACGSCHSPMVGWTGPDSDVNAHGAVYEGALRGRFGNTKPPSAAYAGDSPVLHRDEEGTFVGGLFWNGRASGLDLGDPLAEQAMGPFLNPLEQNIQKKKVIEGIMASEYSDLFIEVWGEGSLDPVNDIEGSYERIARSIAAFERSDEVNPFNSKFDDFWRNATDVGLDITTIDETNWTEFEDLGLDDNELEGLALFNSKGLCADCHLLESVDGKPPLFTDFTYDNLGVPRNSENPFYTQPEEFNPDGEHWLDKGLGGFLQTIDEFAAYAEENIGKQKVPTLRNVDLRQSEGFVKAYMHNGFFKTLKDVVHFYNTRDIGSENWAPPEIDVNVNTDEMGDLGLEDWEEDLIVVFMKTLSDRN